MPDGICFTVAIKGGEREYKDKTRVSDKRLVLLS